MQKSVLKEKKMDLIGLHTTILQTYLCTCIEVFTPPPPTHTHTPLFYLEYLQRFL